jgi:hypothetical protein
LSRRKHTLTTIVTAEVVSTIARVPCTIVVVKGFGEDGSDDAEEDEAGEKMARKEHFRNRLDRRVDRRLDGLMDLQLTVLDSPYIHIFDPSVHLTCQENGHGLQLPVAKIGISNLRHCGAWNLDADAFHFPAKMWDLESPSTFHPSERRISSNDWLSDLAGEDILVFFRRQSHHLYKYL